jgi:hypothetical protein
MTILTVLRHVTTAHASRTARICRLYNEESHFSAGTVTPSCSLSSSAMATRWFAVLAVALICLHCVVCAAPASGGSDDSKQNRARGKLNLKPNSGKFLKTSLSGSGKSRSASIVLPNGQTVNIQVEIICVCMCVCLFS